MESIFQYTPKPNIDRFVNIIKGKVIPDKIPQAELFLDKEIVKQIGENYLGLTWTEPGKDRDSQMRYWDFTVETYYRLGYDYLWVWGKPQFPAQTRVSDVDKREWMETGCGPIQSIADFENYPWPEFTDEDLWMYNYVSQILPEGMGMFVANGDGFLEVVSNILVGYESMCYMIQDDPDLLSMVIDKAGSIIYNSIEKMLSVPRVAGVFIGDDMGFGSGTLFSPDFLRQHILPWHKKLCSLTHNQGKIYLLHSCGHIQDIMEDLITDVGIDGKHSFQDTGYSVKEFKEKYGSRIALLGGVDMDKLCRLEENELRCYIREILECCSKNGRFAIGSGNSIANYVPLEQYFIMLDEIRKFTTRGQ